MGRGPMAVRRALVRSWRRFRRPTLARLVWASLLLPCVAGLGILAWLTREASRVPPSQTPLVVELPPAEPGAPLVRPESPPLARSQARPAPPGRSAPAPPPRPAPAPPAVAKAPEP